MRQPMNRQKNANDASRESFYTDREFMIQESKEDDETPYHEGAS